MRLAITGIGMISSVGRDAVTSCASIRAGLARPGEVSYYQVLDDENAESTPIIGHPVTAYTEGFHLDGRWMRLAEACMEDWLQDTQLPPRTHTAFWKTTGLTLVTPYLDHERFQFPEDVEEEAVIERFGYRLLSSLALPIPHTSIDIVCKGQAGTALAITKAAQKLASSPLERIVVLSVDSYLDPMTLEWLGHHNRLKTTDNPVGLAPGEAAACFLLEAEKAARQRGATLLAVTEKAAMAEEKSHYFTDEVNVGVGLSRAFEQVLNPAVVFNGAMISDLNGETWRAYELATARVQLGERLSEISRLLLPAVSIGDVGAASGAVAVCLVIQSFLRDPTTPDDILISLSTERGAVGAILMEKP